MNATKNKTALITGASRGLGLALAIALAERGWNLIISARNASELLKVQKSLSELTKVDAISGDVIDEIHLLQFPERIAKFGGLDLIINNASTIGASPQPSLLEYPIEVIHQIFHTNVIAPLSLIQKVKAQLKSKPIIINISSDAAIEAYEGWGGYGSSKAALDHLTVILGKENPKWRVYAFDPGDMRTKMHQDAFPGEDISDRPTPEEIAVPAILKLIESDKPSGRYAANEVLKAQLVLK
jgi:NAD(P)-dependent dehydrogenase (short-subunit alcohol dehydrogenase family)